MPDFEEYPVDSDIAADKDNPSAENQKPSTIGSDFADSSHKAQYSSPYDAPQYQSARPYIQSAEPVPPPYSQLPNAAAPYTQYLQPQPTRNYYPQQPGYVPQMYPPVIFPRQSNEGIAIAAMVFGIISLIFFWIPFLNVILSLLALILGIVAKAKGNGGMAISGIVMGVISLLISLLIIASVIYTFKTFNSSDKNYFNSYTDERSSYTASFILR